MGALDDLAKMISGGGYEKPNFAADDPYANIAPIGDALTGQIVAGRDQFGTKDSIIGSLVTGLLSGAGTGLSDNYQSGLKESYNEQLIRSAFGKPTEQGDLSSKLFNTARDNGSLFRVSQQAQAMDEAKKIQQTRESDVFKAFLENPEQTTAALEEMKARANPQPIAAPAETSNEFLDSEAGQFLKRPDDQLEPIAEPAADLGSLYKDKLKEFRGNKTLAEAVAKNELEKPTEALKQADSIRKELSSNKEVSEFTDVRNRLLVLQKAVKDPSVIADLDYVYGIAKILDPGSVVRESEGNTIIASNSIPGATLGMLNKMISGKTALDRGALYNLANRHYDVRKERIGGILDTYSDIAKKRSIDPKDILPYERSSLDLPALEAIAPEATAAIANQLSMIKQKLQAKAPLSPGEISLIDKLNSGGGGGNS